MNEIEQLFEICNKGHQKMSGAAKFWVTLTILSCVITALFFGILVAVEVWK
jgi:hypothetical protein